MNELQYKIDHAFDQYANFLISENTFVKDIKKLGDSDQVKKLVLNKIKKYIWWIEGTILLCEKIYGQCELCEELLSKRTRSVYYYARTIVKGKLPENLHNQMLAENIKNPNEFYVKSYFQFISGTKSKL